MDRTRIASKKLPSGYSLRSPDEGEAGRVHGLATASDGALGLRPSLTEGMIRYLWGRPRFDLGRDAWIIESEKGIVGFGQVWGDTEKRLSAFAIVHPEHTGRGLGTFLAETVERRAMELAVGEARLFSAITTGDEAGAALLAGRGYGFARRFWQMEIELGDEPNRPPVPAGIELRDLDPGRDLPAAHEVLESSFADHWDHTPVSYEEFLEQEVNHEVFDPGLWVLAFDGERLVGVLSGSADDDRGWVEELGVLGSHRGRGIAAALLGESFSKFLGRAIRRVRLNVDSESLTGAVGLYQRVGMEVDSAYDLWVRTIEGRRPNSSG